MSLCEQPSYVCESETIRLMTQQPFISVIIPVYNGSRYLNRCLDTLIASSYPSFEIIVVDDCSTDDSVEISCSKGVTVFQSPHHFNQPTALNFGARKARGDILFFVDQDVEVLPETILQMVTDFEKNPDIAAVFGSYDDAPPEMNFCSQYKNLYHHFVHQHSNSDAETFMTGCGAILRRVFDELGGFDVSSGVFDIELGYRLRKMGYRILLDKKLQVKHLKRWSFSLLVHTDIFRRAIPWSQLIVERQKLINDLNLKISDRISTILVGLSVGILPIALFKLQVLYNILFLLAIVFFLNYQLYVFFLKYKGLKFVLLAFPMHLLYYFYSGMTFLTVSLVTMIRRNVVSDTPKPIFHESGS